MAKSIAGKSQTRRPEVVRRNTNLRLPIELWERIDAESERRGIARSMIIEKMIARELPEWENEPLEPLSY